MARIVDTIIALRIAWLLITPIESTDAYKLGLIDADGKTVRKSKTSEESNATSPLHRLVWNLKRMIGLIPGGSTKIGSLAATYLLMREAYENDWTPEQLNGQFVERFHSLCESKETPEGLDEALDKLIDMIEDAPANATGAAVSTDVPAKLDKGVIRRKKATKQIEVLP
jgi:hypothetical protein